MSALYVLRNVLGDDDLLILLLGRCCSIYRYPLRPAVRVLPPPRWSRAFRDGPHCRVLPNVLDALVLEVATVVTVVGAICD